MKKKDQKVYFSILLALIALVSVSAATVAWFSIADFTKVSSMNIDITSGTNMRFDLDAHGTFEEYVKTLHFTQIADRIRKEKAFDMRTTPLLPVTTSDCVKYTKEDGTVVTDDSGAYLEFTLHFMATEDMIVHLTSAHSEKGKDGTGIASSNAALPEAMRISFTVGNETWIYDPGMEAASEKNERLTYFGLNKADEMVLTDDNRMFRLEKDRDKAVLVHIWLEGSDEACTDALRKADYAIRMRFVGTDEENHILDGTR